MSDDYEPSKPLSPSSVVTVLDGSTSTSTEPKAKSDEVTTIKSICLVPNKIKIEPKSDTEEDTVDLELSAIGVNEKSDLKKDLSFVAEYANGNCSTGKVISLVDKKPSTSTKLHILTLLDKDVDTYRRLMIRGVDMGDLLNPVLYTLINSSDKMVFEGNNVNQKVNIKAGILILYFADILDRFTYLRRYLLNFEIPDRHLEIICTYPNDELPINLIESWKNSNKEEPPPCLSSNAERFLLARQLVLKDIPLNIVSSDLVSAYKSAKKIEFVHDYENIRCAVLTFPDIISCHVSHVIQRTVKIKEKYISSYLMSEMLPNSKLKPIKLKDETDEEAHTRITFNALWQSLISSVEEIKAAKHTPANEKKQDGTENDTVDSTKRKISDEEKDETEAAKRAKAQDDSTKSDGADAVSASSAPKAGSAPSSGAISPQKPSANSKSEAQKTPVQSTRFNSKISPSTPKNSLNLKTPNSGPTSTAPKPSGVKPSEPFKRSTVRLPAVSTSNVRKFVKPAPYKNTGPTKKPFQNPSTMNVKRRPQITSLLDMNISMPMEMPQTQSATEWGSAGAGAGGFSDGTPNSILSSYEYNNMQDMSNLSEPEYTGGGFSSDSNFTSGNSTYELAQQIQMRLAAMRGGGGGQSNFSSGLLNNQAFGRQDFLASSSNTNTNFGGTGGGGGRFYSNEVSGINLDRILGGGRSNASFLSGVDDYDFESLNNQEITSPQNTFRFPGNAKYGRQFPNLDRRH